MMGRASLTTADYFPFIVKDGRTLYLLGTRYQLEGIGFFTQLLRTLTGTPDHYLNLSDPADREYAIARIGLGTDEARFLEMLKILLVTGKIHKELWEKHSTIYCPDLVESLSTLYEKRKNQPLTIEEIIEKISVTGKPITEPEKPITGAEKPKKTKKALELPTETETLARLMVDLHREQWDPGYNPGESRIQVWRKDIDLLNRKDGRSWADIEMVIRYAKTMPVNAKGFTWATNIMSGGKLQEQFDTLYAQALAKNPLAKEEPAAKEVDPEDRRWSMGCVYKDSLIRACKDIGADPMEIIQDDEVYERYLDDPGSFVDDIRMLADVNDFKEFIGKVKAA